MKFNAYKPVDPDERDGFMLTNAYRIITCIPLIICLLLLLFSTTTADRRQKRYRSFFLLSTILIVVGNMLFYALPYAVVIKNLIRVMYFLYAANTGFFFLLTVHYFKLESRIPRWVSTACILFIGLMFLVAATDGVTHWIIDNFQLVQSTPVMVYQSDYEIAYYVNAGFCILLHLYLVALLISSNRFRPRSIRGSLIVFIMGPASYCIGWIIKLIAGHFAFNLIIPASLICTLCYFVSVQGTGVSELLQIQGREVFQYLDEGILLLDKEGHILDMNTAARKLFDVDIRSQSTLLFDDMLQDMVDRHHLLIRPQDNQPGLDLCFIGNALPQFFLLERQPLETVNAIEGGKCIILKNRTNARLIAERLRETAGVDVLTGLPNRYRYQELLRQLDVAKNLPLSILIGDVNGLKIVNDLYGHYEGDMLLKAAANVLQFTCPKEGYVCRIGGDEFAVLLPNTDEDQMMALCSRLELGMKAFDFDDRQLSIALGGATKVSDDQNINYMVHLADKKMYENKNEDR